MFDYVVKLLIYNYLVVSEEADSHKFPESAGWLAVSATHQIKLLDGTQTFKRIIAKKKREDDALRVHLVVGINEGNVLIAYRQFNAADYRWLSSYYSKKAFDLVLQNLSKEH